jgi:L-threonylcarbamoyladenylate synthase
MTSEQQIKNSLAALHGNGIVAFPSVVGWQLACDAADELAVGRLKSNTNASSVCVLIGSDRDLLQYVAAPDPAVFDYLEKIDTPTTIVFDNGIGLAINVLNEDGSISIRVVKDDFTKHLIKRFGKPLAVADLIHSDDRVDLSAGNEDPNWYKICDYLVERSENQLPFKTASLVIWKDESIQY